MDILTQILTFPGFLLAELFRSYSWTIGGLLFVLLVFGAYQIFAKGHSIYTGMTLILVGVFFPLLPGLFGVYDAGSILFWFCVIIGTSAGVAYNLAPSVKEFPGGKTGGIWTKGVISDQGFGKTAAWVLLAFLFILALFIRTSEISTLPQGYSYWELDRAYHAIQYDRGEKGLGDLASLFEGMGRQSSGSPIMMGLSLVFYKVFGITLVTGRIISVFLGLLGLGFLFLFLRSFFPLQTCVFLLFFPSLELVNVVFGRTGFNYISAFTWSAGVLFLFRWTFSSARKNVIDIRGAVLGICVYMSIYMYYPTRVMLLVIPALTVLYFLKNRTFMKEFRYALLSFYISLALVALVHTSGNILNLWPTYGGYIDPRISSTTGGFLQEFIGKIIKGFIPAVQRIVFEFKAIDSTSLFSEGGLLSKPALGLLPFGIGMVLAKYKKPFYFTIILVLCLSILPAVLTAYPNSRRLFLFLSFLLIIPGMTLAVLFSDLSRNLNRRGISVVVGLIILIFFSFNMFMFFDVNQNIKSQRTVHMPFAESGFGDVTYSKFKTETAYRVRDLLKDGDVYLFYSYVYDERPTAPNGAYEQMLIESYSEIKKGGKLVWMNNFYEGFQAHPKRDYQISRFHGIQKTLDLIQNSTRQVHLVFLKPLPDELSILSGLAERFPGAGFQQITGKNEWDQLYILSVKPGEDSPSSKNTRTLKTFDVVNPPDVLGESFASVPKWELESKKTYIHPYSAQTISLDNEGDQYLYSLHGGLYDESGKKLLEDRWRPIVKVLKDPGKVFVLTGDFNENGYLSIYDNNYNLLENIPIHAYPFDAFFGPDGEIYITYLQFNGIGIFYPDQRLELWDTTDLSSFPFWNGTIDESGDFVLLSAERTIHILDSRKNPIRTFPVDVSWNVYSEAPRDRGGMVVLDGMIHMVNAYKNQIISYGKMGGELSPGQSLSLFEIPEGFKIAFLDKQDDTIILINRGEPRWILNFKKVKARL